MGTTNPICHCKCQDQTTEENLQQNNLINNSQYIIKDNSKAKGRPSRTDFFANQSKPIDLDYLKQNTSALKITKFLRQCKYKIIIRNNINKINSKRTSSSSGRILKQKIDFNEKNTKYIGNKNINNNTKEGFGIQLWFGGGKYVGNYKNNQAEGYGVFTSEGDQYLGEFLNDGACGFGVYNHSNGTNYIGYWANDTQDSIGKETWVDGSVYQGEYSQGKKHGIGVYKWPDKAVYEGQWNNNYLNGYGIYYFANNRAYLGEWKNNLKEGFGEFIWQEKCYVGFYKNDKKEGFGIYYWKDAKKAFIGFWKQGKQNGFGKYITADKVKYGIWKAENKIEWFTFGEDVNRYMSQIPLGNYKQYFNYSFEDIKNYYEQKDTLHELIATRREIV